jgi:hypothetical protein
MREKYSNVSKWHRRTRQQSLLLHGWVTGLMVWYLGYTLSRVDYRLAVPRRGDGDSSIGVVWRIRVLARISDTGS